MRSCFRTVSFRFRHCLSLCPPVCLSVCRSVCVCRTGRCGAMQRVTAQLVAGLVAAVLSLLAEQCWADGGGPSLAERVIWAVNAGGEAHIDVHGIHFKKDPLEGKVGKGEWMLGAINWALTPVKVTKKKSCSSEEQIFPEENLCTVRLPQVTTN